MKKQKNPFDCTIEWEFDYKSQEEIKRMDFDERMEERERAIEFAREITDSGENWKLMQYADALAKQPNGTAEEIAALAEWTKVTG